VKVLVVILRLLHLIKLLTDTSVSGKQSKEQGSSKPGSAVSFLFKEQGDFLHQVAFGTSPERCVSELG
jgi:hypothetical protein